MLSVINPDIVERSETPIPETEDTLLTQQPWVGDSEPEPEPESLEQTAFRLTWLASSKLQREYELIEPDLRKVIGDVAVWTNASHWVDEADELNGHNHFFDPETETAMPQPQPEDYTVLHGTEYPPDLKSGETEKELLGPDEIDCSGSMALPLEDKNVSAAQIKSPRPAPRPSSVVVTEIDLDEIGADGDPFSDDEEEEEETEEETEDSTEEEHEDDGNESDWSSDGETYCSSSCGDTNHEGKQRQREEEGDIADCCHPKHDWKIENESEIERESESEIDMWEKYTNLGPTPQSEIVYFRRASTV